ncbi:3'-5' exonuclease [Variovorax sp. J22R133]|uniref:3'-5' exonuclease n=1 Tax=Variovorax brevis TaxID=3053503 RepID=UPI0025749C57|nr:3'-5' exonuclease [Variovorax sp. J22R133]MDM0115720.1 3'-5' exonuclease [Variovorax sp. J22R133]
MTSNRVRLKWTDEQKAIRACESSRIIVEANAGAAKTTTAAFAIAGRIERGAHPKTILALSYTEPGVKAFGAAFARADLSRDVVRQLRVSTVEDFCAARLERFEGIRVRRDKQPEDVRSAVIDAIASARVRVDERFPGEFSLHGTGALAVEGLLEEFGQIKGSMAIQRAGEYFSLTPQSALDLGFSFTTLAVFREYERARTAVLDGQGEQARFRYMGDATYDLARLLIADDPSFSWEDHPLWLGAEAVILDEMHDCNWAIFTVLKKLLEVNDGCTFLGVGDRDQVIHAKDGADSYFMKDGFDIELGEPTRLPLTMTHRFGDSLAQPLGRFAGKAYAASKDRKSGVEVRVANTAEEVLHTVEDAARSRRGLDEDSGLQDLAVLLRHPGDAVELEHLLIVRNLPYETVGFKSFLERPEILFVRMLLAVAVDLQAKFDTNTLKAAKRATWQFVGGITLQGAGSADATERVVDNASEENFRSFVLTHLLRETVPAVAQPIHEAIALAGTNAIGDLSKAIAALRINELAKKVFVRRSDVEEVESSIAGLRNVAKRYASIDSLLNALLQYDHAAKARSQQEKRIVLSTIEASKGLEFDHVIVPGANAGSFDGHSADERNLFYVAASRARNLLTLTHATGRASSFLANFR